MVQRAFEVDRLPHPVDRSCQQAMVQMGISLHAPDVPITQGVADQDGIFRLAAEQRPKRVTRRVDGERSPDTSATPPEDESVLRGARGARAARLLAVRFPPAIAIALMRWGWHLVLARAGTCVSLDAGRVNAMAIRINRVYTRTGDKGDTALVGGRRVPKDSARIEAYGTIDELNAIVGLARVFNAEQLDRGEKYRWLDEVLRKMQNELFDVGSELATPADAVYEGMWRVGAREVTALERLIDTCQKDLEPLKSFVLPGGGRVGGFLHQARTVCRRAERLILALSRVEPIGGDPLAYVNRLSDALFVLSRWVGRHLGETEYLWARGLEAHARKKR
jgi:cob(I)alamin adenosyltransferase